MAYFPLFVELSGKKCLVVGGGRVALRKVKILLDFGAVVSVVAEELCSELRGLETAGQLTARVGSFCQEDLTGQFLVIAATDDNELNSHIAKLCSRGNIPVNVVDKIEECSFIFPAYVKQQNVVAAFSSGGRAPVITQYLKAQAENYVTDELGQINEYMGSIRQRVQRELNTEALRKAAFKDILEFALTEDKIPTEEETGLIIARFKEKHEL